MSHLIEGFGGRVPRRVVIVALTMALASGCVSKPGFMQPAPTRSWPRALSEAKAAVAVGRYDEADRQLASFGESFPGTTEAAESVLWRAIFRLDPSNPKSSPREAGEMLDAYLASSGSAHVVDARVLRRAATQLEKAAAAAEARRKERDEELQRTRDELAKTVAELERIKRRLAAPKS